MQIYLLEVFFSLRVLLFAVMTSSIDNFKAQMKARVRAMIVAEIARKEIEKTRRETDEKLLDRMKQLNAIRLKIKNDRETNRLKKQADKQSILNAIANKCLDDGQKLREKMILKSKNVEEGREKILQHQHFAALAYTAQLNTVHSRVASANLAKIRSAAALVALRDTKEKKAAKRRESRVHPRLAGSIRRVPEHCVKKSDLYERLCAAKRRRDDRKKKEKKQLFSPHAFVVKEYVAKSVNRPIKARKKDTFLKLFNRNSAELRQERDTERKRRVNEILERNMKINKLLDRSELNNEKQKLIRMNFIERAKITKYMSRIRNETKFQNLMRKFKTYTECLQYYYTTISKTVDPLSSILGIMNRFEV